MTPEDRRAGALAALQAAGWGGLSVSEIATLDGCTERTARRLVDELQRAGLARRLSEHGAVVRTGLDTSSPDGPDAAQSRNLAAAEVAVDVRGEAARLESLLRSAAKRVDPRSLSSPADEAAAAEVQERLRARAEEMGRVRSPGTLTALAEGSRDDLERANSYVEQGNREGPSRHEQRERDRADTKKRKDAKRLLEGQLNYLRKLADQHGSNGEGPRTVLQRFRMNGSTIATFTETIRGETPAEKVASGLLAALTHGAVGVDGEWSSTFDPAIHVSDRSLRQWGDASLRLLAPAMTWLESELGMQSRESNRAHELQTARNTLTPALLGHMLKVTPIEATKSSVGVTDPSDKATGPLAGSVKTGVYKTGSRKTERCGRDGNPTAMVLEWGPVDQWDNETRAACSAECAAAFEQDPELSVLGPARRRLV